MVMGKLTARFNDLNNRDGVLRDKLLRTLATTIGAEVKYRIHTDGKKSDGTLIKDGGYSTPYLKYRQKKPFNRTSDIKVILSLTRQMENDWSIIAGDPIKTNDGYGLGFKNTAIYRKSDGGKLTKKQLANEEFKKTGIRTITNHDKYKYMEFLFGKDVKIYALTEKEKELLRKTTEQFINDFNKDA